MKPMGARLWLLPILGALGFGLLLGGCYQPIKSLDEIPPAAPPRVARTSERAPRRPTHATPALTEQNIAPPAPAAAASAAAQSLAPQGAEESGFATADGPEAGESASPEAQPTEVPAAIDLAITTPVQQVSDQSLAALISQASPARAASLRIVDQAREQFLAGRPDDAIRSLGRSVSIDPTDPHSYFYLGRSYFAKKNYQQALTFLQRAELGFGSDPAWLGETLGFEGATYELLGRPTDAETAYKRALEASPGNLMARAGYTRITMPQAPPEPASEPTPEGGSAIEPPPDMPAPSAAPPEPAPPPP